MTLDMKRYLQMIGNKFKAKDVISDTEINVENIFKTQPKTAMILEIELKDCT